MSRTVIVPFEERSGPFYDPRDSDQRVVMDLPFEKADCFGVHSPVIVPARTLLSQLP